MQAEKVEQVRVRLFYVSSVRSGASGEPRRAFPVPDWCAFGIPSGDRRAIGRRSGFFVEIPKAHRKQKTKNGTIRIRLPRSDAKIRGSF
jgi:hypothetical protein